MSTSTSDDWSHLPEALREPESRTRTTTSNEDEYEDEYEDEVPVVVTVFVLVSVRRSRARARLSRFPVMLRKDVTNRQTWSLTLTLRQRQRYEGGVACYLDRMPASRASVSVSPSAT